MLYLYKIKQHTEKQKSTLTILPTWGAPVLLPGPAPLSCFLASCRTFRADRRCVNPREDAVWEDSIKHLSCMQRAYPLKTVAGMSFHARA